LTRINVAFDNPNYSSFEGVLFNSDRTVLIAYPISKSGDYYPIPAPVETIGNYAFYNCRNLTEVSIPNSVTTIGERAFYGCSGLTEVIIPNSVTTIGDEAFYACLNLTDVTNHSIVPQTISNSAFQGTLISNCTLHVPAGTETDYDAAQGWTDFGEIVATL
jgi:hypothetical protein